MARLATEDEETTKPVGRPYKEGPLHRLQDPGFAAEYLTAAADDPEPVVYLSALRNVAEWTTPTSPARQHAESTIRRICVGATGLGICY